MPGLSWTVPLCGLNQRIDINAARRDESFFHLTNAPKWTRVRQRNGHRAFSSLVRIDKRHREYVFAVTMPLRISSAPAARGELPRRIQVRAASIQPLSDSTFSLISQTVLLAELLARDQVMGANTPQAPQHSFFVRSVTVLATCSGR
jgi:hypothetical protein